MSVNGAPGSEGGQTFRSCDREVAGWPSARRKRKTRARDLTVAATLFGRLGLMAILGPGACAQPFHLPTANQALFEPGGEPRFLVGTTGKPWTSGGFGCVRSEGWQMHEGLDIRCLQRDARGEPTDPVCATADGTVAYINTRPSLSNYGNYIILRHAIDGLEIYSLYAHLSAVRPGLNTGEHVQAGEPIAVMGRTSNTRERISKERAHVHFELNLLVNDRFALWLKKFKPGERNDHGDWNGLNLLALDPRAILLDQRRLGTKFSLVDFIRQQTELCRVFVQAKNFPWLRRYASLVVANPKTNQEGIAGYELALNFNGVPLELVPRAPSEVKGKGRIRLLSVNESEQRRNPCRRLVTQRGGRWELTGQGRDLLELLTF
jgi:murein DD-endopeptidase MepM/ murein hydrolase activator NlpD